MHVRGHCDSYSTLFPLGASFLVATAFKLLSYTIGWEKRIRPEEIL